MDQAKDIWGRIMELIRPEMTDFSFRFWIEGMLPIRFTDGILVLQAPTEIAKNTVIRNYYELLTACAQGASELLTEVKIILPDERHLYEEKEEEPREDQSTLYPKYTFDTFVIGNSNHFAHAAAQAVAQNLSQAYNPLFLYSGVGLGKTHLMHAVGHYIMANHPNLKVMYVTSETFTNEMIQSISTNKNKEFRNKYRNVDLLMVDDIQFIAKKEGVQEEFFHTFNALHTANKQIIISSDKPPREIAQLEERLRSRFEMGLIADIQPPDYETRMAILKRRAKEENLTVDNAVLEFIAERVLSNIRELEGALIRVTAYSKFHQKELNISTAAEALKDLLPQKAPKALTIQLIQEVVAEFYKVSVEALNSKRRDTEIAFPRQVAMYLCRTLTDRSLPQIGEAFGGRNHTTVMHAHEKISTQLREDPELATTLKDLQNRLKD